VVDISPNVDRLKEITDDSARIILQNNSIEPDNIEN